MTLKIQGHLPVTAAPDIYPINNRHYGKTKNKQVRWYGMVSKQNLPTQTVDITHDHAHDHALTSFL